MSRLQELREENRKLRMKLKELNLRKWFINNAKPLIQVTYFTGGVLIAIALLRLP